MVAEAQLKIWKKAAIGSIGELIELAHELTGCSVVLGDPILAVTASACEIKTTGWNWEQHISAGYAPMFKDGLPFEQMKRVQYSDTIEGWCGKHVGLNRYFLLLDLHTSSDSCFHLVLSNGNETSLNEQLGTIGVFSQALFAMLSRSNQETNHMSIERFLSLLLREDIVEEEFISGRAKLIGFPTDGCYNLILVDISNYWPTANSMSTIVEHLSRSIGSVVARYEQYLVILMAYDSEEKLHDPRKQEFIAEWLKNNHLVGAISRTFFALSEMRYYYLQTKQMLRLSYLAESTCLIRYPDVAINLLVSGLPDAERKESACHPIVRQLIEVDRDSKFGYLETLEAYLKCGQRAGKACEMLHIHRNTMDYRLHKIEEQVEIDWSDGDALFQIYLSIQKINLNRR